MEKECEQTLLARGAVSEVVYCRSCRVFHVNVEALTVHFEAGAIRDLAETLSAALAAYARIKPASEPAPPATRPRVRLMH
jgi:hypothetical protein